ncbi:MAG TPA: hypothetical protein VGO20_24300 [Arenibaculum sp.]|jgi:hypothetical protein|nr:hypothetical protein [Arenibaculum sp.]
MTDEMMALRSMLEKGTDADVLREMIGFAAQRLMELEVQTRRTASLSPASFCERAGALDGSARRATWAW